MKINLFFLTFILIIPLNIFGQEIEIANLEWGKKVIANKTKIVVAGFNYKEDGYGQSASLICYDKKLKESWRLNLDKEHTNTIDVLTFWDDKIIISGTEGERANKFLKTNRFIKIIKENGEYISEINIGSSTGKATNMIIENNHLYLGYKKSSSIYYSEMMKTSTNAVVKVNLTDMAYNISEYYLQRSTPELIVLNDKAVFVSGTQYKTEKYNVTETFFHNTSDSGSIDNIIPADKMEGLANGITTKNGFTLLSYSNPNVENQDKYLRLDNLNSNGQLLKTKNILFKDLGWTHIGLYFPNIENEFWLYVTKENQKSYYVLLDSTGKELKSIESNTEQAISTDFVTNSKKIIHLIREEDRVKLKIVEI